VPDPHAHGVERRLGLVDHALHIRRHYGSMPSERLYRNLGKAFIAYGEEVARETAR